MIQKTITVKRTKPIRTKYHNYYLNKFVLVAVFIFFITGCAHHIKLAEEKIQTVYMVENSGNDPVSQFAPVFLTHKHQKKYNRIGKPSAIFKDNGQEKIYIDDSNPVIYYMVRNFTTENETYIFSRGTEMLLKCGNSSDFLNSGDGNCKYLL